MRSTCVGVLIDCSSSMVDSLARERGGGPGGNKLESLKEAADGIVSEARLRMEGPGSDNEVKVFVLGFGLTVPGHAVCDLLALRRMVLYGDSPPQQEPPMPGNGNDGHADLRDFAQAQGYDNGMVNRMCNYLEPADAQLLVRALRSNPESVARLKVLIPRTEAKAAYKATKGRIFKRSDPFAEAKSIVVQLIARERGESAGALQQHIEERAARKIEDWLADAPSAMLSLAEAVDLWPDAESGQSAFGEWRRIFLGKTPMCAAMREAKARFADANLIAPGSEKLLFVLTDGESTDGDPKRIAAELKDSGVSIYSCFVASADVAATRRLFGVASSAWTTPAKVMFDVASAAGPANQAVQLLIEHGWSADPWCKLFVQVNNSATLSQFMRSALRSVVEHEDTEGEP